MISFSGIDCAGKSTQIDYVCDYLSQKGKKCRKIWSRGGYTPLLEKVKSIIRSDRNSSEEEHAAYREKVHSNTRKRKLLLWLSIADMVGYYGIYFRVVEIKKIILADRYIWDSYIDYKIKYPEFDFERWFVWKLLVKVYLKPQVSIIYTIPAEESMRRSDLKFEPWPETIELRKIRIDHYMEQIPKKRWKYVIDAMRSIEEVFGETMRILENENI